METKTIVITDITRFADPLHVCVAGLSLDGSSCVRPMKSKDLCAGNPYIECVEIQASGIRPGTILMGDFIPMPNSHPPHTEDHRFDTVLVEQVFNGEALHSALANSAADSIDDGFGVDFGGGKMLLPNGEIPDISIVTVAVSDIWISAQYGAPSVKFKDRTGNESPWLKLNDLGLRNHLEKSANPPEEAKRVARLFRSQPEIYVRVGLTRARSVNGSPEAHWLQVNGIYSFPNMHAELREY